VGRDISNTNGRWSALQINAKYKNQNAVQLAMSWQSHRDKHSTEKYKVQIFLLILSRMILCLSVI
jgi:hypothetical protein